ncbi:hypothetical protein Dsin_020963 [Dipteronia sinensis]|uniref:RNase H type-1 domain-containing protein n=1 Tax=Dipteronia sinensis TaxID=43782 RepID=A0AAE0AAR3_9ROSI|nr:hypothetical protein Dsin_020963 [Dipteronia sinensis]
MAAQPLLKNGIRWRVGDGYQINIWTEPWLPDDSHPRVQSPIVQGTEHAYANSLMTPGVLFWDDDILHDITERNRNEILWNNKRQRIHSLLNLASSYLFQWQSAQVISIGDDLPSADNGLVCWKRPRFGWVKCPFDAGLAEALSFHDALSWLQVHSFFKVIMEIDALKVFQALKSQASDPNYFGPIIDECKVFLKEINDCNVCYVRRSANTVAHALARASCSVSDVHVWGSVPPYFLCNALI